MKNCKFCWIVSLVLAALVATMGYLFIIKGSTHQSEDGRTAIVLTDGERNHILGEMRALLEAVQAITEAVVADDMDAVAESASAVGMALARGEDPTLIAKLPLEFKTDGFAAHNAFDELAQNASSFGDREMVLQDLANILGACTSCHAGYRLAAQEE